MSHHPDLDLDTLLAEAAGRVVPPDVAVRDDLDRGRRRVRRRRAAVGLAALAAVGAVGIGAALLDVDPGPDAFPAAVDPTAPDPAPTTPPPSEPPAPPADPRNAKQLLQDYRDVLAEHLDPSGTHLDRKVTNVQGGSDGSDLGIGTKLGWSNDGESGLGMVEVFVSESMRSQFNFFCDTSTPCDHVRLGGIDAIVQESNGLTIVGVKRADGSVVALQVDTLFGNNSTVAVSGMDLSRADLARTAADERLTLPTAKQIRGIDRAFGWPEY